MKSTLRTLSVATAVSVLGIGSALANPTATVTVQNNFSNTAIFSSPAGCVGTSIPFTDIPGGQPRTFALQSTYDDIQACNIKYTKSGNSAGCTFQVSRLTTFSLGVFRWDVPKVNVTRHGGADCNYTITSFQDTGEIPNGSNGSFSVTLTVDE